MKRFITPDDIVDVLHKFKQRGMGFLLTKLNVKGLNRTEKTFSQIDYESADWWIIPKVKERWNLLISGNPNSDYKSYFVENYLQNRKGLRLISLGSGFSHHEIELAKYSNFEEIVCVDIAKARMDEAEARAHELNLRNMKFVCADFNHYSIPSGYFDIVFFHASLHHFNHIHGFVESTIQNILKPDGLLVMNEFVGATRLQFPRHQIVKINEALQTIPKDYRIRYKSNLLKTKYYGSGIWRMIIADPSECVDSASILPVVHSNFYTIVEKPYGGNILMNVLKDISHHFVSLDSEKSKVLEKLFSLEDEYLATNSSDFVFGIYQKKSATVNNAQLIEDNENVDNSSVDKNRPQ